MFRKEEICWRFDVKKQFWSVPKGEHHLKDVKALNALIFQHSAWRPVHVAAKMGLLPFFQRVKQTNALTKLMQLASQPEQKYPLHIAIENQHIDLVRYMLENDDFSISITDVKGQNALHYAADTSGPMIQLLCYRPEAKDCLNRLNNDGYTPFFLSVVRCRPSCIATFQKYDAVLNILCQGRSPLHEAMLQNNNKVKDVIKTLVDASPKIVNESDPITGDTAIHWATNKLSLSAFLEMCSSSVDLNAVNKTGQTALHRHTFRGDLGCLVCLASYGADQGKLKFKN
uniref:Uncharacterized protein n=1 Tax=Romanomermis culicivorax TaxID=13658 RepID=A0A915KNN4_ROMCU